MSGPYENPKVPPYAERREEVQRLRRRGYVLLSAWDHIIYEGQGRKIWGKLLFSVFGVGILLTREGPSVERRGNE